MYWFTGGKRNTHKVCVKFTNGWNLQKIVGNLEFWEFHNGATDKSVLLGETNLPSHACRKNCIPSDFKDSKRKRTWTSKIWENEGNTILRNAGNRLAIEAASCPRKKKNSSSRHVGKYVKQCSWNMSDVQRWWQFSCRYECKVSLINLN